MEKTPFIEIRGLRKVYKLGKERVVALDDINLTIERGEICCILGTSGSGKSTLLNMMAGLERPTKGQVLYAGKDVTRFDERRWALFRQKNIGFVFQSYNLMTGLSGIENVAMPLMFRGMDKDRRTRIAKEMLREVGLGNRMKHKPTQMSGGQQQRVGIARALCVDPEMVICDEAVSALDVSIQAQVLNLLIKLKKERNLTYIFITHNLSVVEYISDRIAVMYLGRIVELASTEQIFENTMHPYTEALLSAIPIVDPDSKHSRIVLEGDVPNPVHPPEGCHFHPRCPNCMEICRHDSPPLVKHMVNGEEHFCACHLYDAPEEQVTSTKG